MLFHEKLIQRRREKGMTQEDLAERLSVSRQTVSKWENGECMPDADKFIRLADILEISLDELVGREAEPSVRPAPEQPKPGKKLRRLLAAAAACLIFVLGGFALGRYVFPKTAPAAENPQPAALPETLSCSGFTVAGGKASFTANAAIDGKVYLYRSDFPEMKPVSLPAVYENGVYTVENLPVGTYDRMVLVINADGQERSAPVVTNLSIDPDGGAGWTNN